MFQDEERKITELGKKYDEVNIPHEWIEQAIYAGFQKAKIENEHPPLVSEKHKKTIAKWKITVAAVAMILLTLFTSIRISPAVANYIAVLPGMEKIVELIRGDKGLLSAIENEHYHELNISFKKNGVEVILDGVIADEYGFFLFYTVRTDEKQNYVYLEDQNIEPIDGGHFNLSSSSVMYNHTTDEEAKQFTGTLEYFFQEPVTAREMRLDFRVKGETVNEKGAIVFNLPEDLPTKKIYTINETVIIEGQKIHIRELNLTPLRASVFIQEDPDNTKKLLEFQDLRLVDENGETWGKIMNGFTANGISDNETVYYLQSNYFKEPEQLYLVFNKIQALDKDKAAVVIDTEKEIILSQPEGNKLRDLEIKGRDISFNLYTEVEFPYGLFSKVIDGEGNDVDKASTYGSTYREGYHTVGIEVPNLKSLPNPLTLELSFFPEWIEGEGRIKIK